MNNRRTRLTLLFWGGVLLLALILFLYWWMVLRLRAYTDDAYVEGNQVFITPLRPGFVTAIHTDDTFLVKKGELLVELDRTDSEIALGKAKQELGRVVREVCQAVHQVFIYESEIEIRKAALIQAAQDYQHRADVLSEEGVSLEDYQHAVAALREGYFAFKLTKSRYDKALSFVQGSSIRNHPVVLAAADQLRDAWVQLFRCNIYAPVEGLVAQRTIQVGMWVPSGQPLMSVIPLDQIWVNANYKETQMKHMRIGQEARITSDLYGRGVVFHGEVVGLPGGAGNAFSLLPPQNLSGNWIKIVQRLPVRIALDPEEICRHPLRIGLSMESRVYLSNRSGELIPTTSEGSPCYDTRIFDREEYGDERLVDEVFCENLDPTLAYFAENPLEREPFDLDYPLPSILSSLDLSLETTNGLFSYLEDHQ